MLVNIMNVSRLNAFFAPNCAFSKIGGKFLEVFGSFLRTPALRSIAWDGKKSRNGMPKFETVEETPKKMLPLWSSLSIE